MEIQFTDTQNSCTWRNVTGGGGGGRGGVKKSVELVCIRIHSHGGGNY